MGSRGIFKLLKFTPPPKKDEKLGGEIGGKTMKD